MIRVLKLLTACGLPVILAIPAGILLILCQAGDFIARARRRHKVIREEQNFERELQEWR